MVYVSSAVTGAWQECSFGTSCGDVNYTAFGCLRMKHFHFLKEKHTLYLPISFNLLNCIEIWTTTSWATEVNALSANLHCTNDHIDGPISGNIRLADPVSYSKKSKWFNESLTSINAANTICLVFNQCTLLSDSECFV